MSTSAPAPAPAPIRSTIPARIDRMRWSPFHTRMVAGLGAAWILDGLQITIASSVTGVLTQSDTLGMSSTQVGLIASVYLVGQIIGALVFGRMSDKLGRKRLLIITLLLYLLGTGLTAFVTGHHTGWLLFFYGTRLIAGMGIGGQYAAINSAIDEMMPSKYRGRVDIWINGSYWAGAIIGSLAALIFLNAFAPNVGWRLAFLLGPVLALIVIIVARVLPESPRWLMTHGRIEEAEAAVAKIEEIVAKSSGEPLEPVDDSAALVIAPEERYGYINFLKLAFRTYPRRAILGATLMITQSFLYNAIFFTYALVLTQFYDVSATSVPLYGLAFSVGNLMGPLVLAPLFDTVGRKKMISGTYIISGVLLALSAFLFDSGELTAITQTVMWIVIFFFASAGASAAYLTVSETWPIEIRSEAIAVFFTIGTIAGAIGPAFYGALIGDGSSRTGLFIGYLVGAGIMIIGGLVAIKYGIDAEGKSLEDITKPLGAVDESATTASASAAEAAMPASASSPNPAEPPDAADGGAGTSQ
jgi:MFS family permease